MNTEYSQISNKQYIIKNELGTIRTVELFEDNSLIEEILKKENERESIENLIQKEYDNIVNIKNNDIISLLIDTTALCIAITIILCHISTSSPMLPTVIFFTTSTSFIIDKSISIFFLNTKRNRKKNISISENKIKTLEEKLNNIKKEIIILKHKSNFKENDHIKIPSRKIKYKKIEQPTSTYTLESNKKRKPKIRTLKKK